jgi:flagellar biosynthetic protein FliR
VIENWNSVEFLSVWALIFARVGSAAIVLPGIGERFVPLRVRLAVALALSIPLTWLDIVQGTPTEMRGWMIAILSESLTGVVLGVAVRFFLIGLQVAGSIAAQSTSLAQVFGGQSVEPLPAVGHLLTFAGLALLMSNGFAVRLVVTFAESYKIVAFGGRFSSSGMADWGLSLVVWIFEAGFVLAAPFLLTSVLYNLTLGFINKAMPQLMVMFVGAPLITFLSLIILAVGVPMLLTVWQDGVFEFLAYPAGPPE